ncbi:hypothetical protein [Candidatus Viadribacter manganicus]|nr:hypothetical protein [Candidatus Viadribacter manganicus]
MAKRNWAAALLGAATLSLAAPAAAQTRLFSEDSELPIVIEGPIGDLVRRAVRNTDPAPAVLIVGDQRFEMELSPRGFSRRTLGICQFPPLRIDLAGERQGTIMQGQNKLKLVTRCRSGASYEQYIVLEYLTYRMFNEITPLSYRVRPVRTTYRDTAGRRREETQFNFVIEDVGDLARRNRRVALDVQSREVASSQLDPQQAAIVGMFQFMIGNLDWDMVEGAAGEECCHNGKLLAANETSRENVVPVPYDFDYSGFVSTSYSTPPQGMPVPNVRQRYYRGYCRYNDQAQAAAELFRSRRDRLYALIDGESRLSASRRATARAYIEGFFQIIDNPQRYQRQIVDNCRR